MSILVTRKCTALGSCARFLSFLQAPDTGVYVVRCKACKVWRAAARRSISARSAESSDSVWHSPLQLDRFGEVSCDAQHIPRHHLQGCSLPGSLSNAEYHQKMGARPCREMCRGGGGGGKFVSSGRLARGRRRSIDPGGSSGLHGEARRGKRPKLCYRRPPKCESLQVLPWNRKGRKQRLPYEDGAGRLRD